MLLVGAGPATIAAVVGLALAGVAVEGVENIIDRRTRTEREVPSSGRELAGRLARL
jgi:hypothetical protein